MKFSLHVQTRITDWQVIKYLEDLGYDAAWVPDTQMMWSDCYATMALAAANTSKIHIGTGVALRVLQACIGIEDRQRRVAGGEEAVASIRLTVHADIGGQRLVAAAFEMLCPGTDVRMLDGAALLIAGADQILAAGMHAGFGGHAADDRDLVRLLGEIFHRAAELEVGFRFDRRFRSLRRSVFWIKRVDVGHAADHLEEDDVLGFAEAGAAVRIEAAARGSERHPDRQHASNGRGAKGDDGSRAEAHGDGDRCSRIP